MKRVGGGWFVTLEGPEGSGKTIQAQRLHDAAETAGVPVVLTREPGGTPVGELIRDILMAAGHDAVPLGPRTDALLFSAARAQHVDDVIRPALAQGKLVICARYADSTIAYQGYGSGLSIAGLRELERLATDGLRPDLTVLLDLPVELGLARKGRDEQQRFEAGMDLAYHRRVRDGFRTMAAEEPSRFVIVDASADVNAVFDLVREAVMGLTGLAFSGSVQSGAAGSEPKAPRLRMNR
ncbi:MAG: dTMP kinase [Candidatus Limnocylindrales bacterium]